MSFGIENYYSPIILCFFIAIWSSNLSDLSGSLSFGSNLYNLLSSPYIYSSPSPIVYIFSPIHTPSLKYYPHCWISYTMGLFLLPTYDDSILYSLYPTIVSNSSCFFSTFLSITPNALSSAINYLFYQSAPIFTFFLSLLI